MPLFEVIPTTPAIQRLTGELASQLGELDLTQLPMQDKRMKLFEYQRTKKYDEIVDRLLNEFSQTTANVVKLAIETHARAMIPKSSLDELLPQPMLQRLDFGWMTMPLGHIAVLMPVQSPDGLLKAEIQVLNNGYGNYYRVTEWQSGSNVLLFGGAGFRTEPAGIPLLYHRP